MKKLALVLLPSLLLASCSTFNKPLTKEALAGEWICTTKYRGVGTVDVITLNTNGTLEDDNYIFDHTLSAMLDKQVENYFSSPFRYLRISNGSWELSGNILKYNLKPKKFTRLIWKDVWDEIQEIEIAKRTEAKLFNIYSSSDVETMTLSFNKFIKNGFILNQNLNENVYESKCLNKDVSEYRYLELYKKIRGIE